MSTKSKSSKKPTPRKPTKASAAKASLRSAKPKRDYKAEYEKRKARGLAQGLSLSAARGHARKGTTPTAVNEPSASVWREMRRSVTSKYRRTHWRKKLAEHVANVAEVEHYGPIGKKMNRDEWQWLEKSKRYRDKFIKQFLDMGLGNEHQAYSLWYSP